MKIANKSISVLLIVCFSVGQAVFTQNFKANEIKLADNRFGGVDYRRPSRFNSRNYGQGQSYGRPVGPSIIMPSTGRYMKRPRGINPKAASYYNQGLVKYGQGRIDQSIDWMKKAVRVDPRVPNAQYNIAVCFTIRVNLLRQSGGFRRFLDLILAIQTPPIGCLCVLREAQTINLQLVIG